MALMTFAYNILTLKNRWSYAKHFTYYIYGGPLVSTSVRLF